MELKGVLLSQPWGMCGVKSLAARMFVAVEGKRCLDSKIPYGEYIVGGDKFYETFVENKDVYLNTFFKRLTDRELGYTAYSEFGNTLPFSIKILSIETPAPLLCYPSEEKGNLFHSKNVKRYVTGGERHQIVMGLNDFSLLIGFRSMDFIIQVLEKVPEFKLLVDETLIYKFLKTKKKTDFLKVFKLLLDNLPSQVEYIGKVLKDKLLNSAPSSIENFHPLKLFETLIQENPCDVGIFMPYFLNFVKVKNFETIIIPAKTPYIYLHGEALQCSNTVENSSSAAFSSRRDLDVFCESLDIRFLGPDDVANLSAEIRSVGNNISEFLTSSPYYRVFLGTISFGTQSIPRLSSFSIIFIIDGEGSINNSLHLFPGAAFLFYRKEKITFHTYENVCFVQVSINLLA